MEGIGTGWEKRRNAKEYGLIWEDRASAASVGAAWVQCVGFGLRCGGHGPVTRKKAENSSAPCEEFGRGQCRPGPR